MGTGRRWQPWRRCLGGETGLGCAGEVCGGRGKRLGEGRAALEGKCLSPMPSSRDCGWQGQLKMLQGHQLLVFFASGAALILTGAAPEGLAGFGVTTYVLLSLTVSLLSPSSPLPFPLEISSRYARIRQCFHPYDQRHHNQPRPAVDGPAHCHHLHVQPLLPLAPLQPSAAPAVLSGRTHGSPAPRGHQNHRHHSGTETER